MRLLANPRSIRATRLARLLVAGLLSSSAVPALAQAQAPAEDDFSALMNLINTPVTTASKVAQKASDAPATVVVVTADQIRRRGYRSLLQVLEDLPDTKVERRSDPEWYNDVTMRGINGTDTFVILLDGMKISSPTNERIPIMENYPVHMAKQIEVVFGPASALYGADAVSGVVNIITKDPAGNGKLAAESTLAADGDHMRMMNFHGSYDFGSDVRLTVGGQWFYDPLPELDKDWKDFNGFAIQRAGGPFPNPIGLGDPQVPFDREPSYPEKTRAFYAFLKVGDLDFKLFRNSAKVSSSLTYKADVAIANENTFLDQSITALGAQYTKRAGDFTLQTNFTGSRYDLDPTSNFRNAFSSMEPAYKYADGSSFKAEQQVTWAYGTKATVVGGVSYEVLEAVPWSTDLQSPVDTSQSIHGLMRGLPLDKEGNPLAADFFPLKYHNTGAYLQGQICLPHDLSLTLGARQDNNSRYGSTFNPRAGLVWHLNPRHTFKALYGSAFLAPSPLLAYAHFGSFFPNPQQDPQYSYLQFKSAFWRLPNPDLNPLKEKTLEVSYQGAVTSFLNVSVVLYRTRLTNLHQLVGNSLDPAGPQNAEVQRLYPGNEYKGWPVDYIEIRANQGEQTNTGGTVRVDYVQTLMGSWKVNAYASYSFVDGKLDPGGSAPEVDIGLVAPKMARVGVEVQKGTWSLSARYLKVGAQRFGSRDSQGDPFTLPGYGTLNLHLLWDFRSDAGAFLTVSNLTDAHYRNINHEWDPMAASALTEYRGVPQDGRRIGLGVQVRF